MKCFAHSIFKTFLSVVWFIVVVNVMCVFHVVNGGGSEDVVIPKDSASNLNNVTLFSESLSENTILDKNLNLNSTGTLNQTETMALLTTRATRTKQTTTPSIQQQQKQKETDDVLTTPMTLLRLPLSEPLKMTTTTKDVQSDDSAADVEPTAFTTVTTKPTIRTLLGVKTNISTTATATQKHSSTLVAAAIAKSKSYVPKLKIHKTDAPMLNYIFDSYSSAHKHTHHDTRYGPHFEDISTKGNITNMMEQAGTNIHLNCRISLLQDKTVSWMKKNSNENSAFELLTVGLHTYSGDNRYSVEFQYPHNWRLKISNARKSDEGTYECQISTHPPRVMQVNLHINDPKVMIIDEYGAPLQEKYYEMNSTLQLSCIVRNVVMSTSVVYWSHGDEILNYDITRGGISVKTDLMENAANSTLYIAKIRKEDSGNYTCSINPTHQYTIMVHILKGESYAELHHNNTSTSLHRNFYWPITILLPIILMLMTTNFHKICSEIR